MTATTEPSPLPPGPLTVADLEGMPDDGHRYELLDGVLIVTPAPGYSHQMVVGRLFRRLDETAPAGLDVLPARFAVRPQDEGALVVERPFPVRLCPAELLCRRTAQGPGVAH